MAVMSGAGDVTFSREPGARGDTLRLHAANLVVTWDAEGQLTLSLRDDASTRVSGGMLIEPTLATTRRAGVSGPLRLAAADALPEPTPFADAQGTGLTVSRGFHAEALGIAAEVDLRVFAHQDAVALRVTLRNSGAEAVDLQRAFPFVSGAWWARDTLRLAGRAGRFSVYKNGWQSWSYAGGLPPEKRDPRPRVHTMVAWHSPGGAQPAQPYTGVVDVVSEEMGMLGASGLPSALLTGFLSASTWLGQVYYQRREGALAAVVLLDGIRLEPDETLSLPPLWLALGAQTALPCAYAEAVAAELGRRPRQDAPTGWCSWYYYFSEVSEAGIVENLAALGSLEKTAPVELVQIDDGYQTAIGDWLSVNAKFPSGMAALATHIRRAGYRPGIWLAPFTVAATSLVASEHPEWLVRADNGKPAFAGHNWSADLHALDTSHPGARAWLRSVFTTIVREWGYDYLKLDFLACAAIEGTRYDPRATRASALRDGLALIREVVGDDVYLLGCGAPLLNAVGIVDAMRIGPDSAPYWSPRYEGLPVPFSEAHALPTMEGALRNTLTRAWMSPTFWTNDPDCLLVRELRSELTLDEVRAFATAVGLSGGMVVVSDRLTDLPPERLEVVSRLLPPLAERALPDDYFSFGIPQRASMTLAGAAGVVHLVGVFNGSPRDRDVSIAWDALGLPQGTYHATEFWTGRYLGASPTGQNLHVTPHGAALLALRPMSTEPTLLSTSFHISQGAHDVTEWRYDLGERALRWHSKLGRNARGTFSIWFPAGLSPLRAECTTGTASWRREPTGEIVVTADVRGEADFVLFLEGGN